eukprot:973875-Pyramimonas_sp.AAC.1
MSQRLLQPSFGSLDFDVAPGAAAVRDWIARRRCALEAAPASDILLARDPSLKHSAPRSGLSVEPILRSKADPDRWSEIALATGAPADR